MNCRECDLLTFRHRCTAEFCPVEAAFLCCAVLNGMAVFFFLFELSSLHSILHVVKLVFLGMSPFLLLVRSLAVAFWTSGQLIKELLV